MPDAVDVAVGQVRSIAFACFLAAGEYHLGVDLLYLGIGHGYLQFGILLVEGSDSATVAECDRTGVLLGLLVLVCLIHNGSTLDTALDGNVAILLLHHEQRFLAGCANLYTTLGTNGTDDEAHACGNTEGTVVRQRTTLTTRVTAQTCYHSIDGQVVDVALGQLVGMGSHGHVHSVVVQGRNGIRLLVHYEDTLALGIAERGPASLLVVAHLHGLGPVGELLGNGRRVLLYELAGLAVVVVVDRTTAIVCKAVVLCRNANLVTQTCQYYGGVIGCDGCLKFNRTVGIDCPDLVGGELEVVGTEGTVGVLLQGVDTAIVTSVLALQTCRVGSLGNNGEGDLHVAVLLLNDLCILGTVLQVVQTVGKPGLVAPVVVAHEGTECIQAGAIAGNDNALIAVNQLVDSTLLHVELNLEAFTLDGLECLVGIVGNNGLAGLVGNLADSRCCYRGTCHEQLLLELGIALLCPRHILAKEELYLHEHLVLGIQGSEVVGQSVNCLLAGLECHAGTLYGLVLLYALAVNPE